MMEYGARNLTRLIRKNRNHQWWRELRGRIGLAVWWSGGLILGVALLRYFFISFEAHAWVALGLVLPVTVAVVATLLRRPSLQSSAALLDRRFESCSLLSSGWDVLGQQCRELSGSASLVLQRADSLASEKLDKRCWPANENTSAYGWVPVVWLVLGMFLVYLPVEDELAGFGQVPEIGINSSIEQPPALAAGIAGAGQQGTESAAPMAATDQVANPESRDQGGPGSSHSKAVAALQEQPAEAQRGDFSIVAQNNKSTPLDGAQGELVVGSGSQEVASGDAPGATPAHGQKTPGSEFTAGLPIQFIDIERVAGVIGYGGPGKGDELQQATLARGPQGANLAISVAAVPVRYSPLLDPAQRVLISDYLEEIGERP